MNELSDLQQFQLLDKYLRWDYEKGQRETFTEAIDRSMNFAKFKHFNKINESVFDELEAAMHSMDAFPSLRYFQTAGPEATRHPQSIFNCSYLAIDSITSFSETLFLLGLGVGVGYSVERRFTNQLPKVSEYKEWIGSREIVIADSLEGWAHALQQGIYYLYSGIEPKFNFSKLRPAGSPLLTRGGYASGPQPFADALESIVQVFKGASGRKLEPIECHDILCYIAGAIVSGGFRRSAMISLFDVNDSAMFYSKMDDWYTANPQRRFANNSFVVEKEYSLQWWERKMFEVFDGGYGEPGLFSRLAANYTKPDRRVGYVGGFGTNPCGEVVLRPRQFCNLSIANIRADDTLETIKEKARLATIWGTIQAAEDYFPNIDKRWSHNQVIERLLGVDLNGQRDNHLFKDSNALVDLALEEIKQVVIETNLEYAKKLGIRPGAALTCAKPAGNSSVLFDTASGGKPRFAPYYIRRVQVLGISPLASFLASRNVPFAELGMNDKQTLVFSFPVESPEKNTVFAGQSDTLEQLEYWKQIKTRYTEHNPSVTIDYNPNEERLVGKWLFENQNIIGGLSFFPYSNVKYENAPYEEITEQQYNEMKNSFSIDWEAFSNYDEAYFNPTKEFACVGGACDTHL